MANNKIHKSNDKKKTDLLRIRSASFDCTGCYYHPEKNDCPTNKRVKCVQHMFNKPVPFHFIPAFPNDTTN